MAGLQLVEDSRPLLSNSHPYHQHILVKSSTPLPCSLCAIDKHKVPPLLPYLEDPQDFSETYVCHQCQFNMCDKCYKGKLHPFHRHRLQRALPGLIYKDTLGEWKCDSCLAIHSGQEANYHCSVCNVDLCVKCFTGQLVHSLHTHPLIPVDPRILYRCYISWTCDSCTVTYSSTNDTIFYHCHICMFDLCDKCFHGTKHHLHQHRLLPHTKNGFVCTECGHHQPVHHCSQGCNYYLCGDCFDTRPKPHPLHHHPLELCDARLVYPQSDGLWHCDNCTLGGYEGHQSPRPPTELMYHCDQCDFDLCKHCYRKPQESHDIEPHPFNHKQLYNKLEESHEIHVQPHTLNEQFCLNPEGSHDLEPHPFNYEQFYCQPEDPHPFNYKLGSSDTPPPKTPPLLCLVCSTRPATHSLMHGGRSCTLVAVVCEGCAEDLLLDNRGCPYCGEIPQGMHQQ